MNDDLHDVVVIGAGQAGLALAYYLRRAKLDFVLLDAGTEPGGAWLHGWESLRLFSPAGYSSLPGWPMPQPAKPGNPTRDDVIAYLRCLRSTLRLPHRTSCPRTVRRSRDQRSRCLYRRSALACPLCGQRHRDTRGAVIPHYPGQAEFEGEQLHSADYRSPEPFCGKKVLVVGGGNSGAQILAEVSSDTDAVWVTPEPPLFLPDDVDGRVLFERATERFRADREGRTATTPEGGLGNIVMVPSVKEARERGVLHAVRPFAHFTPDGVVWRDGTRSPVDAVVWCTGFQPNLDHLRPLGIVGDDGRVATEGGRSVAEPRLWLLGYGDWTGPASATLIGVARTARDIGGVIVRELAD